MAKSPTSALHGVMSPGYSDSRRLRGLRWVLEEGLQAENLAVWIKQPANRLVECDRSPLPCIWAWPSATTQSPASRHSSIVRSTRRTARRRPRRNQRRTPSRPRGRRPSHQPPTEDLRVRVDHPQTYAPRVPPTERVASELDVLLRHRPLSIPRRRGGCRPETARSENRRLVACAR